MAATTSILEKDAESKKEENLLTVAVKNAEKDQQDSSIDKQNQELMLPIDPSINGGLADGF